MTTPAALDRFDLAILDILQADNTTPQRAIAQAVNLSAPAVQRRIQRLKDSGVIRANVAVLDPVKVGKPLTIVLEVHLGDLFKVFSGSALECNRDEWMPRMRRMGSCPCKQPGRPIARFHSNPSGKCLAGRSAALRRLPIARAIGCARRLASHPGKVLVRPRKDLEQVPTPNAPTAPPRCARASPRKTRCSSVTA